jgi:hypothetical protein
MVPRGPEIRCSSSCRAFRDEEKPSALLVPPVGGPYPRGSRISAMRLGVVGSGEQGPGRGLRSRGGGSQGAVRFRVSGGLAPRPVRCRWSAESNRNRVYHVAGRVWPRSLTMGSLPISECGWLVRSCMNGCCRDLGASTSGVPRLGGGPKSVGGQHSGVGEIVRCRGVLRLLHNRTRPIRQGGSAACSSPPRPPQGALQGGWTCDPGGV